MGDRDQIGGRWRRFFKTDISVLISVLYCDMIHTYDTKTFLNSFFTDRGADRLSSSSLNNDILTTTFARAMVNRQPVSNHNRIFKGGLPCMVESGKVVLILVTLDVGRTVRVRA